MKSRRVGSLTWSWGSRCERKAAMNDGQWH
jgi:hypothetical protein